MKKMGKAVSCVLATALLGGTASVFAGCASDPNTFSWFITKMDDAGIYYDSYEKAQPVQWLNAQYWDVENNALGTAENGENIKLTFSVPIAGAEQDRLSTMFAGGTMTDIMDLTYSLYSPQQLVADGSLMELTDYVNEYLPNYVNYLNENPDVKRLATVTDEDGNVHYYALYCVADAPGDNFMGYMYRRDWLVKYADVPTHIWDRANVLTDPDDPTSVDTSKIHYTDYYEALDHNDWTGWVENTTVTEFTSADGDNPDYDYTDNVIFPSGTDEPLYISDWEWMFRAFKKGIEAEVPDYRNETNAYCTTLYYEGALGLGDLYSSFGGGNPWWYIANNEDGSREAQFGGASDTMRVYLEAMNAWNDSGWLDTRFEQRAGDGQFYQINTSGVSAGWVGMCQMGQAYAGDTIRATQIVNEGVAKDGYMMGAQLPVNDKYGDDNNKFYAPDSKYYSSKLGSAFGISTNAEGKNLPALFTMLNWLYSEEGGALACFGLSKEQYESMDYDPDYYADEGMDCAYTIEDGMYVRHPATQNDNNLQGAACAQRIELFQINAEKARTESTVLAAALDAWNVWENTTDATVYNSFMTQDQSDLYSRRLNQLRTYMDQQLPVYIKNGVSDSEWESYANMLTRYNYAAVNDIYNEIVARVG